MSCGSITPASKTDVSIRGPELQRTDRSGEAICLAVLRRDGFISLDAGEQEGTIQTEPFKLSGTKLHVNVDAPKGELRVELLNGDGNDRGTSRSR